MDRSKRITAALLALLVMLGLTVVSTASAQMEDFEPVTDETLANPDDGDWLMWRRTLNSWGFSPLDQITPENVGDLQYEWARAMEPGNQEGTPLVYDGVMYLPHPGGVIQALDATNGDLIWEYRRELPEDLGEVVGLADITRNIAIHGETVIYNTTDGYIVGLDAQNGQVEWETQVYDYQDNTARQSAGPIVANGKIFSGRSCAPEGGPEACFVTAHDAESGEELWRFYTIPREGEAGDETWGDVPYESRRHVGTWMVPSYDPELDMVYFGTSVTSPYAKLPLGGDPDGEYLYQTSTLALDGETGELEWYHQHLKDHWDLDHPFERLLVDTAVAPDEDEVEWISPDLEQGEERRVMTGIPGKTGIVWTLDRETGEFLWARETTQQNVIEDIDEETGEVSIVEDQIYTEVGQTKMVCPYAGGGKDWQASSYSPETNVMYYPLQNFCMNATLYLEEPAPDDQGLDLSPIMAPGEENAGTLWAISAETGEVLWEYEQRPATMSTVATAGGLVFMGSSDQKFRAIDQETGEVVWERKLGSTVSGYPISYEVDGEQYVAVPAGGALIDGIYLDVTEDVDAARGSNMLYVFKLPANQ